MFMRYNRFQTKSCCITRRKIPFFGRPCREFAAEKGYLRMKKVKKLAALLLAAGMTMSMAACASAPSSDSSSSSTDSSSSTTSTEESSAGETSVDKIKAAGKIVMATNAQFEPFEYIDGTDYKGIDIEISQKIADELGVELEIHDVKFESVIAEITTGKANFAAAGLSITPDRLENVDFSDEYFSATQSIVVMKDGSSVAKPEDLKGKVVGVQTGTTADTYVTDKDGENNVGVKEVKRYNSFVDAVNDMITGRLDAVVMDDFPANKLVEKNADKIVKLDDELTGEKYAIAVPKGDEAMKELVNKVLADMEESGEMDELLTKYIGEE